MNIKLLGAALFGAFLAAGGANAATCTVSSGNGNSGASFEITVANVAQCQSGNDSNTIDGDSVFFDLTGWKLAAKNEDEEDEAADHALTFGLAPVNGDKEGLWEILNPDNYTDVFLTLKAGNGFGAFLLTSDTVISGDWWASKDLSHASIYYRGEPGPAPVPLPATGFLLAGALGAMALRSRRKKA